jgi:membrane associated rhomboid family serine protease
MIVLDIEEIKKAKITISLIFINLISFVLFNIILGNEYVLLLAQINENIFNFEIWRLITSMFMHADPLHLFSNSLALLLFGALLETTQYISKVNYLIIYFLSGLIGNLATLFFLPSQVISLGASGCIFGLIGAAFILIIKENPSLLMLALMYVIYFIISSFAPQVNYFAHIFGIISGIFLGYLFYKKATKDGRYGRY